MFLKRVNDEESAFVDNIRLCTTRQRIMLFRAAAGIASDIEPSVLRIVPNGGRATSRPKSRKPKLSLVASSSEARKA